jgi:transmembrane sensor
MNSATEQAAQWFVRLHEAADDAALNAEFEVWRHAKPEHATEYAAITALWQGFDTPEGSRALARAAARKRRGARTKTVAALVVLLGLVSAPLGWRHWRALPLQTLTLATTKGEIHEFVLPDNSRVLLGADSVLELVYTHGVRQLALQRGEAHFEVHRETSAKRPFTVSAAPARVTVLGTGFVIARKPQHTEVSVLHGRVQVTSSDGAGAPLELSAGEAADVSNHRAPVRSRRGTAEATAYSQGRIVFKNANLSEVAQTLSRYRQRAIVAADGGPRIDAVVQAEAVEEFLRLLPQIVAVRVVEDPQATRLEPR